MLKDYCSVCSDSADVNFIGIRFQDSLPHVSFPIGYTISDDDESVRKDILGLITVLHRFSTQREGQNRIGDGENQTAFPILSYQYVIKYFIAHGYYTEKEVEYHLNNRGKINWKRTIQQIQPHVDNGNFVYLNFITRRSISRTNLLTKIHEFCVYESFSKLGWLYLSTAFLPKKPSLRFNRKMFLSTLNDALKNTFNSDKKLLFSSMIDIVNSVKEQAGIENFHYGVSRFEYVWENLIDYVFGERDKSGNLVNKEKYFPHAHWHIKIDEEYNFESTELKPDTIMKHNGKFYILDAKYYKYGITGRPADLPATSSIQKQITYGDYISAKHFAESDDIYNAFVMPYAAREGEGPLKFVSVGTADWIEYSPETENYKYVLGILLDTKYIFQKYSSHSEEDIKMMSQMILDSIQDYTKTTIV